MKAFTLLLCLFCSALLQAQTAAFPPDDPAHNRQVARPGDAPGFPLRTGLKTTAVRQRLVAVSRYADQRTAPFMVDSIRYRYSATRGAGHRPDFGTLWHYRLPAPDDRPYDTGSYYYANSIAPLWKRSVKKYGSTGDLESELIQYRKGNDIIDSQQYTYRYDLPGRMAARVFSVMSNGGWQKAEEDHYRWDPLESTCRHASLSIL